MFPDHSLNYVMMHDFSVTVTVFVGFDRWSLWSWTLVNHQMIKDKCIADCCVVDMVLMVSHVTVLPHCSVGVLMTVVPVSVLFKIDSFLLFSCFW